MMSGGAVPMVTMLMTTTAPRNQQFCRSPDAPSPVPDPQLRRRLRVHKGHPPQALMACRMPPMIRTLGHKPVVDGHHQCGLLRGVPNLCAIRHWQVLDIDLPGSGF